MVAQESTGTQRSNTAIKRLTLRIHGTVQGVGFRMFVEGHARSLHVKGWVRNVSDGSVRVLAEADEVTLNALLSAVKRGPTGAVVRECQSEWSPASGEFRDFQIVSTETPS